MNSTKTKLPKRKLLTTKNTINFLRFQDIACCFIIEISNVESPVILVKDKAPKSRTAISNTIDNELYEKLKELSIETKIPLNKLLDEAIEYLIKERKS